MSPRRSLLLVVALAAEVALASGATKSAGPSKEQVAKAQIKTIPVAGGVFMLEGVGGNIGAFFGEDGLLVIDSQYAAVSAKVHSALQNISPQQTRSSAATYAVCMKETAVKMRNLFEAPLLHTYCSSLGPIPKCAWSFRNSNGSS